MHTLNPAESHPPLAEEFAQSGTNNPPPTTHHPQPTTRNPPPTTGLATKDDILLEEAFEQKPMSKATFLRLLSYVRPYRRLLQFNLVLTLLATLSQLLGPKFIQIGFDRYLTNFTSTQIAFRGILAVSAIYFANLL